jgi:hypothetical protein
VRRGTATIAIEMARNVERMANSALMLNPDYLANIERYVKGAGNRTDEKAHARAKSPFHSNNASKP